MLASRSGALARGTELQWTELCGSGAAVVISRCEVDQPADVRRLLLDCAGGGGLPPPNPNPNPNPSSNPDPNPNPNQVRDLRERCGGAGPPNP